MRDLAMPYLRNGDYETYNRLRARYAWEHDPQYYGMRRADQARELIKRGASVEEIAILFDVIRDCARYHVLNAMRADGMVPPRRPEGMTTGETLRLKERMRRHYQGQLPGEIIWPQVHAEFDAMVARVHAAGATYRAIAVRLGVSATTISVRVHRYERRRRYGTPIERYFEERDDLRRLAYDWRRARPLYDLSNIPDVILFMEADRRRGKT